MSVTLDVAESARLSATYTYFIQAGLCGDIKIGISNDPEGRRRQLQTGNSERLVILAVLPGDHESYFHQKFRRHRLEGEWFQGDIVRVYLVSHQFEALKSKLGMHNAPIGCLTWFTGSLDAVGRRVVVMSLILFVLILLLLAPLMGTHQR
ncbi:GIY-YIG nuclease family protein [Stieleria maiorica]|uniref:GIY-YIG nuclease family protein n=1 Tax=Stieleria maiorica TaxID=2795974 RepID=UPI00142F3052|nr:GIY-YIG nuclease family protein [Stieleria maiorica]